VPAFRRRRLPARDESRADIAAGRGDAPAVHHSQGVPVVLAGRRRACMRCPELTTVTYDLSLETREVSGLPVITET